MATDLSALKQVIKLVSDAVNDIEKSNGDSSSLGKLLEFKNLIPDLLAILPKLGDVPSELSGLNATDLASLLMELETDLQLPPGKSAGIVAAAVKLLSDLAVVVGADVQALVLAVKA